MIEITDVQVFVVNEEKLKAYVTVTLGDCFLIRDLKVINGHSGLFVAMPAKKRKDGVFRDIAHPLNQQMRERLEEQVLEAFRKAMEEHESGVSEFSSASGN